MSSWWGVHGQAIDRGALRLRVLDVGARAVHAAVRGQVVGEALDDVLHHLGLGIEAVSTLRRVGPDELAHPGEGGRSFVVVHHPGSVSEEADS